MLKQQVYFEALMLIAIQRPSVPRQVRDLGRRVSAATEEQRLRKDGHPTGLRAESRWPKADPCSWPYKLIPEGTFPYSARDGWGALEIRQPPYTSRVFSV